jgi:hypothetical protein
MNNHALNVIVDLLRNGDKAVCLRYDPVGTDNTVLAKEARRDDRRRGAHDAEAPYFPLPDDITRLAYLDLTTDRL